MVELSRSFLRERLSRQAPASTLAGVPALPRIPDESARFAQAGEALAAGLQAAGTAAAAFISRDNRLKQAQETAQAAQQIGNFQLGLAPLEAQMVTENVPYLERPDYLKTHGQELIDTLVDTVPERLQTAFQAEATQQLARLVLHQQSVASQQFVDEQKTSFASVIDLLARQRVSSDPRQHPAIDASLYALRDNYVQSGILTQGYADVVIRKAIDTTDTQRAQNAIIAQPQAMEEHLTQLAAGQAGLPNLPIPPPQDLPELVRQAQTQVRQDLERFEHSERRAAQDLTRVQEQQAMRLESRLLQSDLTLDQVRQIGQETRTLGDKGLLRKEDHGQILRETRAMEQALLAGPAVTDPALTRRMLIALHGELGGENLDLLRDNVVQWLEDGRVSTKDAQAWFGDITRQRQANYYTNMPEYKEGRQFLDQAVNYLNNITFSDVANKQEIEILQNRVAFALQGYSQRMREIWERDGVRGVQAQAAQVARDVQAMFNATPREVLDFFPEPAILNQVPRGGTVDERYTEAYQRLQAAPLPNAEKAEQYRLLQQRQRLETQVERGEEALRRQPGPRASPGAPPPAAPPPRPPGDLGREMQRFKP